MKVVPWVMALAITGSSGVLLFGGSAVNTSFTSSSVGSVEVSAADKFPGGLPKCPAGHLTITSGNSGTPAHLSFTNDGSKSEDVYLNVTAATFTPTGASYPLYLNGGDDFNNLPKTAITLPFPAKLLVGSVDAGETLEGPVFLSRDHSPGDTLDDVDATYVLTGTDDTCASA